MNQVTFSLPTLSTSEMSPQDQINVSVNQATAVIVSAYLDHLNQLTEALLPPGGNPSDPAQLSVLSQAELVSLINDVQGALRSA